MTYSTNILVRLLTVNIENCLTPKIRKCATPLQSNATLSSGTSPSAFHMYQEVLHPGGRARVWWGRTNTQGLTVTENEGIAFASRTASPSRGTDDQVKWRSRTTNNIQQALKNTCRFYYLKKFYYFTKMYSFAACLWTISPKIWDSKDLRPDVYRTRKAVSFYVQYSVCTCNRGTQRPFSVKDLFGGVKIT